jgi:hypothetical protein
MTWIFFLHLAGWHGRCSDHHWCTEEFRILLVVLSMQQRLMELVFALCNLLCNLWTLCFCLLCLIIMQVWNFVPLFCSCIHDASWLFCIRQFQTLLWLTMYYRSCTCLLCRHVCKQARRWSLLLLLFSMEFTVVSNWQQILQFICLERTWIGSCANLQIWKLENKLDLT